MNPTNPNPEMQLKNMREAGKGRRTKDKIGQPRCRVSLRFQRTREGHIVMSIQIN
jgi:hypothetical protein